MHLQGLAELGVSQQGRAERAHLQARHVAGVVQHELRRHECSRRSPEAVPRQHHALVASEQVLNPGARRLLGQQQRAVVYSALQLHTSPERLDGIQGVLGERRGSRVDEQGSRVLISGTQTASESVDWLLAWFKRFGCC